MSNDYINALADAFDRSPSDDDATMLKRAVKYLNFHRSSSDDQDAVRGCHALRKADADGVSFPCHAHPGLRDRVAAGHLTTDDHCLYGYFLAKRIIGDRWKEIADTFDYLADATRRVEAFAEKWKSLHGDDHFFWVTDIPHDRDENRDRLEDILMGLGLYHWNRVEQDESIVVLKLEAGERRKPSWIDAELTFYFAVWPGDATYGKTRCLRTGKPRYSEWIAKKRHLSVKDVTVVRLGTMLELGKPPQAYWKALRDEVEKERAAA